MAEVQSMIATLGFPIAVCLICFWYINKQEVRHSEEVSKMTEAIQNNTIALTTLVENIKGEEKNEQ